MLVPSRHGSPDAYRYGFNGKEKDGETKGEGNSINYEARFHDPRIGRFLSIDPLFKAFAWFSPYQFSGNSPISCVDLDGLEMYFAADGSFLGQSKKGGTEIRIATKYTPYKAHKNGKIDEGFLISKSLPISQFSLATQGKVYQTIYDREIGGNATVIADINYHRKNAEDEPISQGTGAHTLSPLGKGAIVMNARFHEFMVLNDRNVFGIGNGDYYSAATNLKHEERHFLGLGADPWSDHFKVWVETYKEIETDGTFSKLSEIYKDYLDNVGGGYIDEIKRSLNSPEYTKGEDFERGYEIYESHVKQYNEHVNEKRKIKLTSKKDFLEARKGKT